MHLLYTICWTYPYWALPLALICAEIAIFFRRKRSRLQFTFAIIAGLIVLSILFWFIFRGDLHTTRWVNQFFNQSVQAEIQ